MPSQCYPHVSKCHRTIIAMLFLPATIFAPKTAILSTSKSLLSFENMKKLRKTKCNRNVIEMLLQCSVGLVMMNEKREAGVNDENQRIVPGCRGRGFGI